MANPTVVPIMTPATGPGGPFANPIYLVDVYGNPITGSNGTSANGGAVPITNVMVVEAGIWDGGNNILPIRAATGDSIGGGNVIMTAAGLYNPTVGNFDRVREITTFKPFNGQALTATSGNTPTSIWTPASGKKFRLMGYWFSLSAAAGLVFHDLATVGGGGVIPIPSPLAAAAGIVQSPPIGNGFLSATANNQLWIDATAAATVTGFVWGTEE